MRRAAVAVLAAAAVSAGAVAIAGTGTPGPIRDAASWRTYETDVNPGSSVQFVSPRTGFALAGQPVNALDDLLAAPGGLTIAWPSPAVLVSHDGGHKWRRSLSSPAGFWGLAFADRLHGIAVGVTELYRTADGGQRWQRIPEPGQPLVRAAYLTDRATVAGVTTGGHLVFSRNGGSSWQGSVWKGSADAVCAQGRHVVVADRSGGVWISKDPGSPFERVAHGLTPQIQYGPWWIDLSCGGPNAVEFMLSACEAACGGGEQTIVRQSAAGADGLVWRRVVEVNDGAANPGAPEPATTVSVGTRAACGFSSNGRPTLEIECTHNGAGRSHTPAFH